MIGSAREVGGGLSAFSAFVTNQAAMVQLYTKYDSNADTSGSRGLVCPEH